MPPTPPAKQPVNPRALLIDYTCPCGTTFPSKIYNTVNVTLEPHLLYQLLAGTLNTATCPNCGRRSASAQPFIYHDMARGLFAYIHPQAEVEPEERDTILEALRRSYFQAVQAAEELTQPRASSVQGTPTPRIRRRTPGEDLARMEPETPPMQIIFGTADLVALVDSLLEPEERLGRVALSTRSARSGERERLHTIAEQLAKPLGCLIDVDDAPEEYTVWVYGPRSRIATLSKALGRG